jgi:hypothetical protein
MFGACGIERNAAIRIERRIIGQYFVIPIEHPEQHHTDVKWKFQEFHCVGAEFLW